MEQLFSTQSPLRGEKHALICKTVEPETLLLMHRFVDFSLIYVLFFKFKISHRGRQLQLGSFKNKTQQSTATVAVFHFKLNVRILPSHVLLSAHPFILKFAQSSVWRV